MQLLTESACRRRAKEQAREQLRIASQYLENALMQQRELELLAGGDGATDALIQKLRNLETEAYEKYNDRLEDYAEILDEYRAELHVSLANT